MKTIIITGKQGSGKTKLAKIITHKRITHFSEGIPDMRFVDTYNDFIVCELTFREFSSSDFQMIIKNFRGDFRKPYSTSYSDFSHATIIAVVQSDNPIESRHHLSFHLSK